VVVCVGLLLSLADRAQGDASNRNFLPFGERAAMLANAGITSDATEAVYYNPANLARVGQSELSVSGSTFLRFEASSDAILELQGVDQPFDASGFVVIPSTIVSTYPIGDWTLATAVLVPDAFEIRNRVTFETPDLRITQLLDQRRQSLWLGAGAARMIAPGLSVGLSAFVTNETEAEINFLRLQAGDPASAILEQTTSTEVSVFNLSAIAGVMWEPTPQLGIGARIHSQTLRLTGSGDIYRSVIQLGTMMDVIAEDELEGVRVGRPLPWDAGAGIAYRPRPDLELVADVSVQLPATLTTVDDAIAGVTEHEVELAPRAGVGAEWEFSQRKWLRLGVTYNASAVPAPEAAGDGISEDYLGVTGGVSWQKDRTTTSLGAFYLQTNASMIIDGSDPPREGELVGRLYGALFAVSYSL